MTRVWWTIPESSIAWEWRPEDALIVEGVRVAGADGTECLRYEESWRGPAAYQGLPAGQPLADMTAQFAEECNLRPENMRITWIEGDTAVRWDRSAGRWTRHDVEPRPAGPAVGRAATTLDVPDAAEVFRGQPVKGAGEIAAGLLGLTTVAGPGDDLARAVEENQRAIAARGL